LELALEDTDGKRVALSDPAFRGKVVVLDLFGSWCTNCHELARYLVQWYESYHERGLEIIGIAFEFEDAAERARRYKREKHLPYPVLVGPSPLEAHELLGGLSIRSFPTVIFIDRRGRVQAVQAGFRGGKAGPFHTRAVAAMEARIRALLDRASD
jgi:thiol-disulfide isomerase/thioredoxin